MSPATMDGLLHFLSAFVSHKKFWEKSWLTYVSSFVKHIPYHCVKKVRTDWTDNTVQRSNVVSVFRIHACIREILHQHRVEWSPAPHTYKQLLLKTDRWRLSAEKEQVRSCLGPSASLLHKERWSCGVAGWDISRLKQQPVNASFVSLTILSIRYSEGGVQWLQEAKC